MELINRLDIVVDKTKTAMDNCSKYNDDNILKELIEKINQFKTKLTQII